MNELTTKINIKNTLVQQCNHWLDEFNKLNKNINGNKDLKIEALGCAKGNLCILKELDKDNNHKYEKFLEAINHELEYLYNKKENKVLKHKIILNNSKNNNLIN